MLTLRAFSLRAQSLALLFMAAASHGAAQSPELFQKQCAGCHGENAAGGDRAPALVNNRSLRNWSESRIHDLIKNGSAGGMPAFALPEPDLQSLAHWVHVQNSSAYDAQPLGDASAGEHFFFAKGRCSTCHMVRGVGASNGPDLSSIGLQSTVREIELVLQDPTSQMATHSAAWCPPWAFCRDESWNVADVRLNDGTSLRGFTRHQGKEDLQLQTFDGSIHSLKAGDYALTKRETISYMPPLQSTSEERQNLIAYLSKLNGPILGPLTSEQKPIAALLPKPGDWPTYNGVPGGNRNSRLANINTRNVSRLTLAWVHPLRSPDLQATPLVSDGVMYVTAPNQLCGLDARTGSEIWCYGYQSSADGPLGRQPNRGAALLGDRVFFVTDAAHLLCLNRITGGVMWEVNMANTPGRYSATSAPLVVGDLVISGIAGGDGPLRGFLAAYQATTGEESWRFWTIPSPDSPAAETWKGNALKTGGGATWLTGSYDSETGTLYWAVGNPYPATDGDERAGVNLYTNCVIALDAKTGKLRWYYQFTPHDLHDWDATEPFLLVDAPFHGHPRKLLLQANRNGFFYVLDRTTGEFLLAKAFVKQLNWATAIGSDGKPLLTAANKPTKTGTKTCPAVRGATNWYSTAFQNSLLYVMAVEDCSFYRATQNGGYEGIHDPANLSAKVLRAINIETGDIAWEIPQVGSPEANYSGVLSTEGGLLFYGETGGTFAAVDSKTGNRLWSFPTNAIWRASPMTYMVDGYQYVAITSGSNVLSFTLPEK
jgi:PQQ-dependent dehydrogenase (methanol/ethanol family)